MFSKLVALSTLAILAVATPTPQTGGGGFCETGSVECCESTVSESSPSGSKLLGLLGVVPKDVTGLIGFNCSPISVIGAGSGNSCDANVVCCQNNGGVGGLISIGCVPVIL